MLNTYCDMVDMIAKRGELKRCFINGILFGDHLIHVNVIDGFEYRSDPESPAVEVVYKGDPFISRWFDGELCRKHLGRYDSINKIKEHYVQNGGIL